MKSRQTKLIYHKEINKRMYQFWQIHEVNGKVTEVKWPK